MLIDLTTANPVPCGYDRRAELAAALARTSPTRAVDAIGSDPPSEDPLWDVARALVRLRAHHQPVDRSPAVAGATDPTA